MTEQDARIHVMIADDEPLARRRLSALLARTPDFEVVAECADGAEVVRYARERQPDVLFLDIQMPEFSGLEAVRLLEQPVPEIVFVTAYEDYAVDAFQVHALDYLLKPYDEERFGQTLGRIRERLGTARIVANHERLVAFMASLEPADRRTDLVRQQLVVADIAVDPAARRVHRGGNKILLRRKEFDVLVKLIERAGEVVTKRELMQSVWGYKEDVVSRTLDQHVFELRRKLGHAPGQAGYIQTELRVGYRLLAASE